MVRWAPEHLDAINAEPNAILAVGAPIALARVARPRPPAHIAARSWTAQQRLCGPFRRLAARKNSRSIVTVAIARELAGFLWAEMTAA